MQLVRGEQEIIFIITSQFLKAEDCDFTGQIEDVPKEVRRQRNLWVHDRRPLQILQWDPSEMYWDCCK